MSVFLRTFRGKSGSKAASRSAARSRKSSRFGAGLRLENLEQRVLLDGAGGAATGPATHFVFEAPRYITAGAPAELELVALDAANHEVRNYTGTVHIASSDSAAVLPADYTFTASDHGHHEFHITLNATGSQTVTASDTLDASITDTVTLNVNPAPVATHFGLLAPETATLGASFGTIVVALDAANHPVRNYTGTLHFTSTDGAATLPGDYTFTAADHGKHVFQVTLNTSGAQTITAADTAASTVAGSVTVNADPTGVATHFGVLSRENVTAGKSFDTVVVALDAANHPVLNYTGTVHLTSTDTSGVLPADYTFTAGDHGVHKFHVTLNTTGSQTITATDTASSTIAGSVTVNVNPAPVATHFALYAAENVKAGKSFDLVVVALDAANHRVWDYTGTVQFASGDASAVLPADYTFTAADHGRHVFHVKLNTLGSETITVTDASNGSLKGTIAVTVVSPPATTGGSGSGHHHGHHSQGHDAFFSSFAAETSRLLRGRR